MRSAASWEHLHEKQICHSTPETLRQLLVVRVVQVAGPPGVAFPLCSDLCRVKYLKQKGHSSLPWNI